MQFTAQQIAAIAGGTVEGDGNVVVSTVAKIEEGKPGAISFLANPKYTHFIYETESSAVLVGRDFVPEKPVKPTLIRVDDPYATVASLLQTVASMMEPRVEGIEQPCFISEGVEVPEGAYVGAFAYIGKNVVLGKNVKIFPQTYVGDNCVIGDDTVLKPGVKVYHGCHIGKRCIIHSGAVIGADGFGFAPVDGRYNKIPQIGIVEIADDVEIGANTTIDRATMGSTVIKEGVKLDNLIQVAHNCVVGEHTVMAAQAGVAGSTKVGDHCMVGGQVGLAGHITVGSGSELGAQAGIATSVRPGSRLLGSPAIDVRKYARQVVFTKNIESLYDRVKALEEKMKNAEI